MVAASIDGVKLKQAIGEFGSLEKAIESLKHQIETLSKQRNKLKQENEALGLSKNKLIAGIHDLNNQFNDQKIKLQSLVESFGKWERQYNLFQSFLAMLVASPSVSSSLKSLISLMQELATSGWAITKNAEDLRSHFVHTIMGDYLKCFRCKACGARFMVNKEPHYKSISNHYQCPSCYNSHGVEPDDSFLKAMVSEEQMENIILLEKTLKENEVLKPLKAFQDVPCEICGKPITEWTADSVKGAVEGWGWGHGKCWNSDMGKLRLTLKLIKYAQDKKYGKP
jgi:regulator of replication initiation timing